MCVVQIHFQDFNAFNTSLFQLFFPYTCIVLWPFLTQNNFLFVVFHQLHEVYLLLGHQSAIALSWSFVLNAFSSF